jgi:hypothetical protein
MKVSMESIGEIVAEATTLVAGAAEAQPVLAHLREALPKNSKLRVKLIWLEHETYNK